jgi:hypothetical protein
MSSFLTALDAEIAELEATLNADPKAVKLRELRRVRDLYETNSTSTHKAPDLAMEALFSVPLVKRSVGRKPSPERQRALAAAREFLAGKIAPTKTAEIYEHLVKSGITVGGTDPTNNLSAMLYHAPEFRSHKRSGWTLLTKEAVQ